jgi:protein-L-isoaspartate(D-aspartate) O-methyltransferase
MAPRDVSKLLQAVAPRPGERALAIAAPYAAAILARLGCTVTALQPEGEAAEAARRALDGEGVKLVAGDLNALGEDGPYDVIVCEGAVARCPAAWIEAVAERGRLGVVERNGPVGKARLYRRGEDGVVASRELFDATPPILAGFEAAAGFSF